MLRISITGLSDQMKLNEVTELLGRLRMTIVGVVEEKEGRVSDGKICYHVPAKPLISEGWHGKRVFISLWGFTTKDWLKLPQPTCLTVFEEPILTALKLSATEQFKTFNQEVIVQCSIVNESCVV